MRAAARRPRRADHWLRRVDDRVFVCMVRLRSPTDESRPGRFLGGMAIVFPAAIPRHPRRGSSLQDGGLGAPEQPSAEHHGLLGHGPETATHVHIDQAERLDLGVDLLRRGIGMLLGSAHVRVRSLQPLGENLASELEVSHLAVLVGVLGAGEHAHRDASGGHERSSLRSGQ